MEVARLEFQVQQVFRVVVDAGVVQGRQGGGPEALQRGGGLLAQFKIVAGEFFDEKGGLFEIGRGRGRAFFRCRGRIG